MGIIREERFPLKRKKGFDGNHSRGKIPLEEEKGL
jgi:hypothetical protein